MNEHAPVELDEQHEKLLADYRAHRDVPSDVRARVWRQLDSDDARPAEAPSHRGVVRWWVGALVAAAALLSAGIWVSRQLLERAPTSRSAAEYERPAPAPREAAEAPAHGTAARAFPSLDDPDPPPNPPEPSADAATEAPRRHSARAKPRVKPSSDAAKPPPSTPDSLREEARLLARAQAALGAGDFTATLSALGEHGRRFPRGSMAQERRALEVIALCQSGRRKRGRQRLKAFLAKHPRSVLRQRATDACKEP